MKLERIPEYLTVTVVILIGMVVAVIAGKMSGAGQGQKVILVVGAVIAVMAAIQMRTRSWLLIPILGALGGSFPKLKFPLSAEYLAIPYVFGIFLVLKALKLVRRKPRIDRVDLLMVCLLLLLVAAFIRNPVGVLMFESDRVGGRPYIAVAIACLGHWVLSRSAMTPKQAMWLPWVITALACFDSAAGFIGDHFPALGNSLGLIYSGFAGADLLGASSADESSSLSGGIDRKAYLVSGAKRLVQLVCSFFDPITALNPLYFFRFAAFLSGILMALFSGFRSQLVDITAFFLVAGCFRRGSAHLVRTALIGVPALALLVFAQGTIVDLPLSVQRSLCFLPGHWDADTKSDAKGSEEWRYEMWKEAMTTNRYIQNKLWGDGFGVDRKVLDSVLEAQSRNISLYIRAEGQAIMGGFHSGPISTIRFVGYIGLVFYLLLTIAMMLKALKLIRLAKRTPYFSFALFCCVGWLIHPFYFTFVFGQFETGFPEVIIGIGMMKMLETSLSEYQAERNSGSESNDPASERDNPLPGERSLLGRALPN